MISPRMRSFNIRVFPEMFHTLFLFRSFLLLLVRSYLLFLVSSSKSTSKYDREHKLVGWFYKKNQKISSSFILKWNDEILRDIGQHDAFSHKRHKEFLPVHCFYFGSAVSDQVPVEREERSCALSEALEWKARWSERFCKLWSSVVI